ncbi:MAG: hypothetical protein J0L67_16230 [Cytophagales bacterium]|nr:hypothetical protein [Cytophagales bacterium]
MKNILTILFGCITAIGYSQDLPDLKNYKYDIGFNTNFIFNGIFSSGSTPFEIMLKKQKTSNKAFRFGGNIYVNSSTSTGANYSGYTEGSNYTLRAFVGKEKQEQISKYWIFYYGSDLGVSYLYNYNGYANNSIISNESTIYDIGGFLTPFLGIRFQINERIYIATEASLQATYAKRFANWKTYDGNGDLDTETKNEFNNFSFNLRPAAGIFFFYRF